MLSLRCMLLQFKMITPFVVLVKALHAALAKCAYQEQANGPLR